MTEQTTDTFSVSYMQATIKGQEVKDFKTLARETGEFEGVITTSKDGWRQTLVVKFLPSGKRSEVPFETIESNPRSGVLRRLPVVGVLMAILLKDE